jgi:acyl-[acyl-carrier-protein]-phospholipid O-acyltransferase/long-chain-fatty-acid--[acyl-carrier-protein] ligase
MRQNVFKINGFLIYLVVIFINSFVDLGHKIIIQNTIFKNYDGSEQIVLTAIVNALILLPFILLFTPSGYLSDKYAKNKVMRTSAWAAFIITLAITYSYYAGLFWVSFAMTFLLAVQSALYSPAKYGFIREIIGDKHLAEGNGVVQATTIISILFSTFLFSILFEYLLKHQLNLENMSKDTLLLYIAPLGWLLVALTFIELVLAYRLPQKTATQKNMSFDWANYKSGHTQRKTLSIVYENKFIWLSILGLSVFWSVAQVILAAYPAFAKAHLAIERVDVMQGLLACIGIGIMIGSLVAGRISRDHIESGLIPVGAMGIAFSTAAITFLDSIWLQITNFIFLGIMGGFFIVPLNAYMQYHAPKGQLGRTLAAYNFIHNGMMLLFLALTAFLAYKGLDSIHLFFVMSTLVVIGSIYTIKMLPQSLLRFLITRLFHSQYRMHVLGFENIPASGGVLLLGNHISWIDWALVQIAAPRSVHFVMDQGYYQRWYLTWFLKLFGVVPISSKSSTSAINTISGLLKEGKAVCLFPEGAISRTGQLAEFKRGYERTLEGTDAIIIPFYLHGLWGSRFSRSSQFLKANRKSGFKHNVIVAFGQQLPTNTEADTLKRRIFDLSVTSWQNFANDIDPIPVQWLQIAKQMGRRMASTDIIGKPLNNYTFITAVFRFAALIKQRSPEQNIGLLLPTSTAGAITNMAVLSLGKTIVNLNYTASQSALHSAIEKAEIKTIYTSRKFMQKLKQKGMDIEVIFADSTLNVSVHYLEDLKEKMSRTQMLTTLIAVVILPTRLLQMLYLQRMPLEQTAAILFSSGSEGSPKGIELSHKNLAANARQVADTLNTREDDIIMSILPTFHAFGLSASTLMPLSEGIPIVCHPDPTDVLKIARGIARYQGTIMFGTSTFYRLYTKNRRIHPLTLDSLRLLVAGAEKLNPDIRDAFQLKFCKAIFEGYGATETSPVASVNVADELETSQWNIQIGNKQGSVGMALPGTSFRIVDPISMQELDTNEDGLILISGPQVMKGYLHDAEKTAEAITLHDNQRWYKSGDKGHLDQDGFLTIVDRYSRFAKIGGEMISLTAVEEQVHQVLKKLDKFEIELVAVNTPDDKKGEKITLLIADQEIIGKELKKALINAKTNVLMIPSTFINVDEVPKLGSGKTDFNAAKKQVLDLSQ